MATRDMNCPSVPAVNHDEAIATQLLPGEQIEWRASPAWNKAARPPRRGLILAGMTVFALLATLIMVIVIGAGDESEPDSLGRSIHASAMIVAIALTVYLWIKAAGRVFALFERLAPRSG